MQLCGWLGLRPMRISGVRESHPHTWAEWGRSGFSSKAGLGAGVSRGRGHGGGEATTEFSLRFPSCLGAIRTAIPGGLTSGLGEAHPGFNGSPKDPDFPPRKFKWGPTESL